MMRAVAASLALLALLLTAEPSVARSRMSFVPGGHGGYEAPRQGRFHSARRGRQRAATTSGAVSGSARGEPDEAPTEAGKPGAGFTMQDGVLTYPAPARFQPKNLKHP